MFIQKLSIFVFKIDENWESCYGQTEFDTDAMPDPLEMTNFLHDLGFNVTLWTHPFINTECAAYVEAENLNLFFNDIDNKTTKINWWHGEGGLLDFFEPSTVEWFNRRLLKLKNTYKILFKSRGFNFVIGGIFIWQYLKRTFINIFSFYLFTCVLRL
jgi:alpha-glucosidase (family GH31 glycosyl hydrolase)